MDLDKFIDRDDSQALFAILCLSTSVYKDIKSVSSLKKDYEHLISLDCSATLNSDRKKVAQVTETDSQHLEQLLSLDPDFTFVIGDLNDEKDGINHNYLVNLAVQKGLKVISILSKPKELNEGLTKQLNAVHHPLFFTDNNIQKQDHSALVKSLFAIIDMQATPIMIGVDFADIVNVFKSNGLGNYSTIKFENPSPTKEDISSAFKTLPHITRRFDQPTAILINTSLSESQLETFNIDLATELVETFMESIHGKWDLVFGVTYSISTKTGFDLNIFTTELPKDHPWVKELESTNA